MMRVNGTVSSDATCDDSDKKNYICTFKYTVIINATVVDCAHVASGGMVTDAQVEGGVLS